MTAPKFTIGQRVFRVDCEGRILSTLVESIPQGQMPAASFSDANEYQPYILKGVTGWQAECDFFATLDGAVEDFVAYMKKEMQVIN